MSSYSDCDTQPAQSGKVIMRVPTFIRNRGWGVEDPTCPNCSDDEPVPGEESDPGELDPYDECGIMRPRYRDSPRINEVDFELAFKKIADISGDGYVPGEQDHNSGFSARNLLSLVSEGGLVYGPRSFVMPYVACNIDDLTHCDPTSEEIEYLSDEESNIYLEGMKNVGGSGRKPLLSTRTNDPDGPLLRPATGATFILARLRSFLYGVGGHFTALMYLMTHLFKCVLLTIGVICAGGVRYCTGRPIIIVNSTFCLLVAWEFLIVLHRTVFPSSSSTLPLRPDFTAIAGKEMGGEEKANDAGYTEDDEDEELRQLEPTELSPLPSESAPQSDENMSTRRFLKWLWCCFYEYVSLDCLYLPLMPLDCLYLLSLYPLITSLYISPLPGLN